MLAPLKTFARLAVHRTETWSPLSFVWNILFRTGEQIAFARLHGLAGVSTVYLREKIIKAPHSLAGRDLDFTVVVKECPPEAYRQRLATIRSKYDCLRRLIPFLGELELIREDRFAAYQTLGGGSLSALKEFRLRHGNLPVSPTRPRAVLRDALLRTFAHLTPKYLEWKRAPTPTRLLELDHAVKQVHLRLDHLEGVCSSPYGYTPVWNRLGTICRQWFPVGPVRAKSGVRRYPMFGRPDRALTVVLFAGSAERAADGLSLPPEPPPVHEALYPSSYPIVISHDVLPAFLELFPFESAPLAAELNHYPSTGSVKERVHSRLADCLMNQGTFLALGENGAARLAEMLKMLRSFRVCLETGNGQWSDDETVPQTLHELHGATDEEISRCLASPGLSSSSRFAE